jgi:hypothetical protein
VLRVKALGLVLQLCLGQRERHEPRRGTRSSNPASSSRESSANLIFGRAQ